MVEAVTSARRKTQGPKQDHLIRHYVLLWCAVHCQCIPMRRVFVRPSFFPFLTVPFSWARISSATRSQFVPEFNIISVT
jgi:hypothetical protein